jgi:hypothetical protein
MDGKQISISPFTPFPLKGDSMADQRDVFLMEIVSELHLEVANACDQTRETHSLFHENAYRELFTEHDSGAIHHALERAEYFLEQARSKIQKRKCAVAHLEQLFPEKHTFTVADLEAAEELLM